MADHATALAAGVLLLRDRLAVWTKSSPRPAMSWTTPPTRSIRRLTAPARTSTLSGPTCAASARGSPPPAPVQPARPQAQPVRAKVAPRRVRPVRQPAPPEPVKRLRRAARGQRPVSQELGEALDRLDKQT